MEAVLTRTFIALGVLLAAGCTTPGRSEQVAPASLSFAVPGTTKGFPGSFRTLDGKAIANTPSTMQLVPGRHVIGYWCPDTLVMDGPPTVSAVFESGKAYVLECRANEEGQVREKNP